MTYSCAVIPCADYDKKSVRFALEEAIEKTDGLDFVQKGMRIAIKPNLVSFKAPEDAATTHPALLAALVEMLVEMGASVVIGDCPGGPHSVGMLNKVYASTGMQQLERLGATLNRDLSSRTVGIGGAALKELTYASFLAEADAIIDFCKLKSHALMGMSAAVKNLFGVVPGLLKPQMHYRYKNEVEFAEMLVDINEFIKPRLSIMDAVVGMEGNGPLSGTPRRVGAVVAAKSQYHCDLVGASLIGLEPAGVPTIVEANRRGLSPLEMKELDVFGDVDALRVSDFAAPPVRGLRFMRKGTLLSLVTSAALAQKPALDADRCVGCGECERLCPAKAISMKGKKPSINRKSCIRCFCCQEFCPRGAMVIKRPIIARTLNRLGL